MLEQLRTSRFSQVMLAGVVLAACFACFAVTGAVLFLTSPAEQPARQVEASIESQAPVDPTPAFSLVLPQEVRSDGWTFTVNQVDHLEMMSHSGKTYTPKNGVFLVLLGTITNSGGGCLRGQDFIARAGGRQYEMERDLLEAAKGIYNVDYPGLIRGQCIDDGAAEPSFLVFDVARDSADLRLLFRQAELQLGDVAIILTATPAVAYQPVLAEAPGPAETPEPTATATAVVPPTETATEVVQPTDTPVPTDTPQPEPTAPATIPTLPPPVATPPESQEAQLRAAIAAALGESNREVERLTLVSFDQFLGVINVHWAINDSLTADWIKESARRDIADMLKAIRETGLSYYIVNFEGTFSLIDQLGNANERTVVWATYEQETVDQINWTRFSMDNLYDVASTSKRHPAFED